MAGNVVVLRLACMNRGVPRELLGIFTLDSIKTTPFDDHIGLYPGLRSCGIYIITPIGVRPPHSIPYACRLPNSFPRIFLPKSCDIKAGNVSMYEPAEKPNRIPTDPTVPGREYLQGKP